MCASHATCPVPSAWDALHFPIRQTPILKNFSLSTLSSESLIPKAVTDSPPRGPHQVVGTYPLYTEEEGHGTVEGI